MRIAQLRYSNRKIEIIKIIFCKKINYTRHKHATNLYKETTSWLLMPPDQPEEQQVIRVRIPQGKEVLGIVQQRLGGSRMKVLCLDSKERICRIPGRLRRELWVRENDVVIIEPWDLGGEDKGDVVYKYRGKAEVDFLKRKGYLKSIQEDL